jgi:hypothetical protein
MRKLAVYVTKELDEPIESMEEIHQIIGRNSTIRVRLPEELVQILKVLVARHLIKQY